jgi:ElaB/YqjD/DUF883 family membrane-anchored ribosome-binding protein
MEETAVRGTSVFRLFRVLSSDTRTLLRQEVALAKTEISEKLSRMGRNAVALLAGGLIAFAGLIVLLVGLGWLLAYAINSAGVQPLLAAFIGLGGIGLLVAIVGGLWVLKAAKSISKESLAPQRTLHTLHELKGPQPVSETVPGSGKAAEKPSSAEMQARVEATETRMGETLDELGYRFSPSHINSQVKQRIQAKPYSSGLVAMGAGLLSGLLLTRRHRRA